MYWIVFNNDHALAVCTSQEQADDEVDARKAEFRAQAEKNCAGRPAWELRTALNVNFFHWHEVPASKII